MVLKLEEVELGKRYQLANGIIRRVFEIIPDPTVKQGVVSVNDIIRYEAEKWGYDMEKGGPHTRARIKVREKLTRKDFAKDVYKRLD